MENAIEQILLQYGWIGIFVVILIMIGGYFLLRYFKNVNSKFSLEISTNMDKMAHELSQNITDQNAILVNKITEQNTKLIDFLINKDNDVTTLHQDKLNERIMLTEEINNALKDFLYNNDADGAYVIEFHNSYSNLNDIPFAKYSCTFERISRKVKCSLVNKWKGMPISSIVSIIGKLDTKYRCCQYDDISKLMEDNPTLYVLLSELECASLLFSGLYDKNDKIFGIILLVYKEEIPEDLNMDLIVADTIQMASMLNLNYKFEKK